MRAQLGDSVIGAIPCESKTRFLPNQSLLFTCQTVTSWTDDILKHMAENFNAYSRNAPYQTVPAKPWLCRRYLTFALPLCVKPW